MSERSGHPADEERMEQLVGNLLRLGVIIAAVVTLAGAVVFLVGNAGTPVSYHVFRGQPAPMRSVLGILHDALALHSTGIIQLGILLLIATPIARVALSLLGFARQRDRLYVVVTGIVLSLLLCALLIS